ncbi:MAG: XRE family transcriptional regulator [Chloroflexi bacterium]|nr:XRE family transcriptional regulator [Chloroflexota bacterium]
MVLGERLATVRKELGISQVSLAAAMGKNYTQSMISNVESGRRGLLAEGLAQASRVLGVSVDYLLGLTDNPSQLPVVKIEEADDAYKVVDIPELSGIISPSAILDANVSRKVAFPRKWLVEMEVDPADCFLVRFQDDSMLPTLPVDCRLLVDRGSQLPADKKLCLLDSVEGVVVKRVHRHEDLGWVLRSDNRVYGAVPLDETLRIVGEIKWYDAASWWRF